MGGKAHIECSSPSPDVSRTVVVRLSRGPATEGESGGMEISDCGFICRNRWVVVDERICDSYMKIFDTINELPKCIRDKFSIRYYQSEFRSPKSKIRRRSQQTIRGISGLDLFTLSTVDFEASSL